MPIYEYYCPQCKNQFELRMQFSESSRTPLCPNCKSEAQKLISSFACKTGGSIQATEQPFRKEMASRTGKTTNTGTASLTTGVLITPPPEHIELLSSPGKRPVRTRGKKKDQNKKGSQ